MSAPFSFILPPELSAKEPPERRGLARDHVRLMVIERAGARVTHTRFDHVGQFLRRGGLREGMQLVFGEGLTGTVSERDERIPRLWRLRFSKSGPELINLLYRLGRPVRYEYVSAPWDLDYYQTV